MKVVKEGEKKHQDRSTKIKVIYTHFGHCSQDKEKSEIQISDAIRVLYDSVIHQSKIVAPLENKKEGKKLVSIIIFSS